MSDNKVMAIIAVAFLGTMAVVSVFGGDVFDSENTKQKKASEKTRQLEIQFKIDSLKSFQNNGKK